MNALKRMMKFIKGGHWYELDYNSHVYWEVDYAYMHCLRYHDKPLRKRRYYRRKSYFVKYESHRKKGIDYLPF